MFFPEKFDFILPENILFKGYKIGTWGNLNGIKQHSISLELKKLYQRKFKKKPKKILSKKIFKQKYLCQTPVQWKSLGISWK